MTSPLLPRSFFVREVDAVARDLVGRHLVRDPDTEREVVLRITEVEAYGGPEDSASHCRAGRTRRNEPMWQLGGITYVYLCYGIHQMLNVVTGSEGVGQAVLIRACEPVGGIATIRERRRARGDSIRPELLTGPGRVGEALALDRSFSGVPLFSPEAPLQLREGTPALRVRTGPRIGVEFAAPKDRAARRRIADADSRFVSRPAELTRPVVLRR